MDRLTSTQACVIPWLLCAVVVCLAVHSPHCDLCDGPYFVASSSHQSHVNHPRPATPDTCNGICSCCGFRGLPNATPVLDLVNTVTTGVWPESPSPSPGPRSPIFRPPRIAVPLSLSALRPLAWKHTTSFWRLDMRIRSVTLAGACLFLFLCLPGLGQTSPVNFQLIHKQPTTIKTL